MLEVEGVENDDSRNVFHHPIQPTNDNDGSRITQWELGFGNNELY
jgi:hypothetical protein